MLTLVLIASLFSVAYTNECPHGTQQIGGGGVVGATQSGNYKTGITVEDCKYYCLTMGSNCKAFTYDNDVNTGGLSLCVPYRYDGGRDVFVDDNHPRSDQVLCAMEMCPLGTAQVGPQGAVGQHQISAPRTGYSIEQCFGWCRSLNGHCESFTFDDHRGSNSGYSGDNRYSSCVLYGEDSVASVYTNEAHPQSDQLLCAISDEDTVICPTGSTQIATTGSGFYGMSLRYYFRMSKEMCRSYCYSYNYNGEQCTAFAYDGDYGAENVSPSLCRLYNANSDTRIGQYSSGSPLSDQVLCSIRTFTAQAPSGVFNFDGISMVDGNGNGMEITGNYVIYIVGFVIVMVVVNVICLMMYCWKKLNKGSKVNYKLVSIRSDTETDIEHQ